MVVPSNDYAASFNEMSTNIKIVTQYVNNVPPAQNMHLAIAANVLSNQSYAVLKNLAAALNPNGFILLEETAAQLDLEVALTKTDLSLAGKQTDLLGKNYVLLKKRTKKGEPIVIQITEKNISWLEDVKVALKKSKSQEVLLVSQGEEMAGKKKAMFMLRKQHDKVLVLL